MESLFEICLKFIALNIDGVVSLMDFPDIVGKLLAQKVTEVHCKTALDKQFADVIRLFTEAYGCEVLSSLNLRRSAYLQSSDRLGETHRRVNAQSSQALYNIIQLSSSGLSELDLSYCTACRSQEWLSMIGQCRLKVLVLRGLDLTNKDINILSVCASIRKSGLHSLEKLDISENSISASSMTRIERYPNLKHLNVSSTFIKKGDINTDVWCIDQGTTNHMSINVVVSSGWFGDSIHSKSQCDKKPAKAKTFYKSSQLKPIRTDDLILSKNLQSSHTKQRSHIREPLKRKSITPNTELQKKPRKSCDQMSDLMRLYS